VRSYRLLRLKRGEDRRLRAGHLWVFSNEVDTDATPLTDFAIGSMVRVVSDRDQFLGYGYVNPACVDLRADREPQSDASA
jgi:23S rRNA (cytosine1962-C5)-methyltransferase